MSVSAPALAFSEKALIIVSAAILPLYFSMFRYDLGGIYFRVADLLLLLLLIGSLRFHPAAFLKLVDIRFGLLALLSLYIVLQGIWLNNLPASLKEASQLLIAGIWLSLSAYYIEKNPAQYFKYLLAFMALSVLYTVLYHFSVGRYINYKLNNGRFAFGLLTVLVFLASIKNHWRSPWPLLVLLSFIVLFFSMERKGMLVSLLVVTLYILHRCLGAGRLRIIAGAVVISLLLLGLVFSGEIIDGYRSMVYKNYFISEEFARYTSNIHRASLLLNGSQILLKNPLFGLGADNVSYYMFDYYLAPELANNTHNFFLDTLLKYGVVGFVILLCTTLMGIIKYRIEPVDGVLYGLFCIYCLAVVTFMVDGQASLATFLLPSFMGGLFYRCTEQSA